MSRRLFTRALVPVLFVALAACTSANSATNAATRKVTLRLGYFPNITHGTALVGVRRGIFACDLGPNVTLKTATFNAGSGRGRRAPLRRARRRVRRAEPRDQRVAEIARERDQDRLG